MYVVRTYMIHGVHGFKQPPKNSLDQKNPRFSPTYSPMVSDYHECEQRFLTSIILQNDFILLLCHPMLWCWRIPMVCVYTVACCMRVMLSFDRLRTLCYVVYYLCSHVIIGRRVVAIAHPMRLKTMYGVYQNRLTRRTLLISLWEMTMVNQTCNTMNE
ncbi:hypothetical protein GGR54DRAFT_604643 [Hypoxylon sp. NC1633]|nr:hypothetical protein GGR54DRAFT_604643 [Hypoxylon sp. NC1633]